MKIRRHFLLWILIISAICILSVHQLRFVSDATTRPSHSFVSYYTASYLLAQGKDANLFYNDDWFRLQVSQITPQIEEYYSPNPPTTALLLLPLAHRNHDDARIICIGLNVLWVLGALVGILRMERVSRLEGAMVIFIVLIYQPLWANFEYGQVYGLLFVMMTLIWYAYRYRCDAVAGGLLGTILIMKTAGLFIFPLLVIKKRWTMLLSSMIVILLIVLVTLPLLGGISTWLAFIERLAEYGQRPSAAVTAYQSISGFFKHHLTYHPTWNPFPLANNPTLATLLSFMTMGVLLAVTLFKGKHDQNPKWTFCALVILGVIMSPVSVDYHYTPLLLPILLVLVDHQQMTLWQKAGFVVAVGLLSVDYPYQQDMYSQTFLSLMAYPKLIGALILWVVCVRISVNE